MQLMKSESFDSWRILSRHFLACSRHWREWRKLSAVIAWPSFCCVTFSSKDTWSPRIYSIKYKFNLVCVGGKMLKTFLAISLQDIKGSDSCFPFFYIHFWRLRTPLDGTSSDEASGKTVYSTDTTNIKDTKHFFASQHDLSKAQDRLVQLR